MATPSPFRFHDPPLLSSIFPPSSPFLFFSASSTTCEATRFTSLSRRLDRTGWFYRFFTTNFDAKSLVTSNPSRWVSSRSTDRDGNQRALSNWDATGKHEPRGRGRDNCSPGVTTRAHFINISAVVSSPCYQFRAASANLMKHVPEYEYDVFTSFNRLNAVRELFHSQGRFDEFSRRTWRDPTRHRGGGRKKIKKGRKSGDHLYTLWFLVFSRGSPFSIFLFLLSLARAISLVCKTLVDECVVKGTRPFAKVAWRLKHTEHPSSEFYPAF